MKDLQLKTKKRRKLDSVSKGAHKCIRAFRLNLEIRYGVDITATKIKLKKRNEIATP